MVGRLKREGQANGKMKFCRGGPPRLPNMGAHACAPKRFSAQARRGVTDHGTSSDLKYHGCSEIARGTTSPHPVSSAEDDDLLN